MNLTQNYCIINAKSYLVLLLNKLKTAHIYIINFCFILFLQTIIDTCNFNFQFANVVFVNTIKREQYNNIIASSQLLRQTHTKVVESLLQLFDKFAKTIV